MKNRIYQLVGLDKNLALFQVPEKFDTDRSVQDVFDIAFESFDTGDNDYLLNDVCDWLEEVHGITRIFINNEVFTDKL